MRIRFLSAFEPPFSFYRDLLPFLADRGVEIDLLIGDVEYRKARKSLDEVISHTNVTIHRVPVVEVGSSSTLHKATIYFTYVVRASFRTLIEKTPDLNFFLSQPPLFAIWGYILKLIRGQRYCVLVMDLYPDVAVRGGIVAERAWITHLLTLLSRLTLRKADIVIALGRCMQEYLEKEKVPSHRINVIPNWSNAGIHPVPDDKNQLRQEYGIEGDFVVLYSGNMGLSHFFDDILEVAARLRDIENLRFIFIGNGVRRKEIEQAKEERNLNNVMLLPFQPVDRLAHSSSMGNIHFISLRAGFEGIVVPSKTYSALAAGRAVVYQGNRQGEIARMIEEEKVGTVVPLCDADVLEKVILCYYRDPELVREQGIRAQKLSESQYSRECSLEKYAKVLFGS